MLAEPEKIECRPKINNTDMQVIQERRGIVSKLEIEARMRENKAQAQVVANTYNVEILAPNLSLTKPKSKK